MKNAMSVYDRAAKSVAIDERYDMYILYINKATEFFGVTKTRPVYEAAIQNVSEGKIKDISVRYADLERTLGEVDRARAIYVYGSQYCDPCKDEELWQRWHAFEVRHGNEDTFREMLRIKRSVQLQFTTRHVNSADVGAALLAEGPSAVRNLSNLVYSSSYGIECAAALHSRAYLQR